MRHPVFVHIALVVTDLREVKTLNCSVIIFLYILLDIETRKIKPHSFNHEVRCTNLKVAHHHCFVNYLYIQGTVIHNFTIWYGTIQ